MGEFSIFHWLILLFVVVGIPYYLLRKRNENWKRRQLLPSPTQRRSWTLDVRRLRVWFVAYLIVWGLGIGAALIPSELDAAGRYVFLFSIVPYLLCIVFAYRVQRQWNAAGLYRAGAWQIIVGAILLNPFLLGFVIPASVLWRSRRIMRTVSGFQPSEDTKRG